MEVIGLEKRIDSLAMARVIRQLFPAKRILFFEGIWEKGFLLTDAPEPEPAPEPIEDYTNIFTLEVEEHPSEFATRVTLYRASEEHSAARELYLAVQLAAYFDCRTIVNCPGHLADHPFCSLVVDSTGRMFEADDSDTAWGDGDGGPVRLVRAVELPLTRFDAAGHPCGKPQA